MLPLGGHFYSAGDTAEPTLWGIYGVHDKHDCPVNNRETAKQVIAVSMTDLQPVSRQR